MIDIEQRDSTLQISFFDKEGDISIKKFLIPSSEMYEWEYCDDRDRQAEPGVKSWDGKSVKKRRTKFLSKWRLEEYLWSLPEEETRDIYEFNIPKKFFVDIEVEVTDEWPKPETAKFPVTTLAFCRENKVIVMGTKVLKAEEIESIGKRINEYLKEDVDFSYLYFKSEYDMLYTFFYKAIQKMPVITGWNFIGFDWTYLINRCKRLNIDPAVASPSRKLVGQDELPQHRLVVDYLDVYKKWDRTIDVKENNTLDWVAKAALGIQKVKYAGTLQELYESDFDKYVFYNAVDAKLVQMIDRKLNTMMAFLKLGNISKVEATRAYSPIWMAEAAMARENCRRNRVFPKADTSKKKREAYEGAFVHEPKTGLYEWVTSFDFASLYPTVMRQWNISPESYIKNVAPGEDVDLEKYIKTASGAVFSRDEESVFKSILVEYYGKRKAAKKTAQEIEKEIAELQKYIV
jgi:DNA polymerase elongation subunit (family B)